jgi:hypothetical protein
VSVRGVGGGKPLGLHGVCAGGGKPSGLPDELKLAHADEPDHVHIVAQGVRDDSDLRSSVRSWNTTMGFRWRRAHASPLWQPGYYDHVLWAEDGRLGVARYVLLNPVRAGLVEKAQDYPFSGSGPYTITQILDAAEEWKPSW